MKRTIAALAALALCAGAWAAETVPAPVLKYVLATGGGSDLYLRLDGKITDSAGLRARLDGADYLGGLSKTVKLTASGASVQLGGFKRAMGEFGAQLTSLDNTSGTSVLKVDATSNTVKVRRTADVYVANFWTETRTDLAPGAGVQAAVLVPNAPIGDEPQSSDVSNRVYGVRVNGTTDLKLVKASGGGYIKAGEYVIKDNKVIFPLSNLKDRAGSVALTVDGVPSNVFAVERRTDWIQGLSKVEYQEEGDDLMMRVYLTKTDALADVADKDVLVNGTAVDKTAKSTFGSNLVVRLKMGSLSTGTKHLVFQVRDPATGLASDPLAVDTSKILDFAVSKVAVLPASSSFATLRMSMGDGHLLYGDVVNYVATVNGLEYGPYGTKVEVKNADGSTKKDINGVVEYEIVRRIQMRRVEGSLEFDLDASVLKDANTLVLKDTKLNRTAATVTFDKAGKLTVAAVAAPKQEKLSFTPGSDLSAKTYDFVNKFPDPFKMGTLEFADLDKDAQYELSFTASLDADHVPFSRLTYADEPLATFQDRETLKVSFGYFRRAKGSDLPAAGALAWLPGGLRSEKPFRMSVTDVTLRRLGSDGVYHDVAVLQKAASAAFTWTYRETGCWDGGTEECNAAGYGDPTLVVDFSASGKAVAQAVAAPAAPVAQAPAAQPQQQAAAKPSVDASALLAAEPALGRAQKQQAAQTADKLAAWARAKGKGDAARAKRLGDAIAAAVDQKLPELPAATRAYLRVVVANLKAKLP